MVKISWTVPMLCALVTWLLLMGAGRLCMVEIPRGRYLFGAFLAGIYAGACLLEGRLGDWYWRGGFLAFIAFTVFYGTGFRTMGVYASLELIFSAVTQERRWGLLAALIALFLLFRFYPGGLSGQLVPVSLSLGQKRVRFTALRDTGNCLTDPVTGQPVLVVGAQLAAQLLGLTQEQLRDPVKTLENIPGLRLIPYKTIDRSGSMLLAKRFPDVRIGSWRGSRLVAFAPEQICGGYEGLTGGCVC